jgi:hypothetical protein
MKVAVTEYHLKHGRPCHGNACPIALALIEKTSADVYVYGKYVRFFVGGQAVRIYLPKDAQQFVFNYDEGHPTQPFEFELETPCSLPA